MWRTAPASGCQIANHGNAVFNSPLMYSFHIVLFTAEYSCPVHKLTSSVIMTSDNKIVPESHIVLFLLI